MSHTFDNILLTFDNGWVRRIAHSYPTSPRTLEELSLPANYTHSSSGETLLLWDSSYTSELRRSFLFGTPTITRTLLEAGHIIIDGTFKSAPQLFTEMVGIHGIFDGGWHIPLAYGLLPGRTNSLYTALFEALDRFGPYNPRSVFCDFEIGLHNAVTNTWPSTTL